MEARFLLIWNEMRFGRTTLAANIARRSVLAGAVTAGMFLGGFAQAQIVKAPRYQGGVDAPVQQVNLPPLPAAITPHGTVVEDVVVRVNDQIISRSEVTRAEQQMEQESSQQHASPAELAVQQKNMLRDMIDKQLLLSRAKELGLNADADLVRQINDIRKQNKMDSEEDLERAVKQQGSSYEDFKAQLKNQILTQQVVRDEVGRRLQMSQADEQKYYDEHKSEFLQPEQVKLSEILIPVSENATAAELSQAEAKANDVKTQVMKGDNFADLAKKYSGGPSAAQGGELGAFKRGALAKVLEDQTFSLKPGESTQPIRTRQGYVILKVNGHDQEGPAPLASVEPQIQEAMYMNAMQPALRAYLTKLREDAYIDIQPGFVDSGASAKETHPVFSAYAPPPTKKKSAKKTAARFDRSGRVVPAKAVVSSPDTTGGRTITGAEARENTPDTSPAGTTLATIAPPKPSKNGKAPKMAKKEKIRYGQAPRTSLPAGSEDVATYDGGARTNGPTVGSLTTPGTPSIPDQTATADLADNPLTPRAPEEKKTRFSSREAEVKARKENTLSAKQVEKINAKPEAQTADEAATQKVQAAPLGVAGDTSKKPKKPKKVKGAPKERLEDKKPTPKAAPAQIDQTASPSLAPTQVAPAPTTPKSQSQQVPNSSVPRPAPNTPNDTTLPPVTQPVPGSQIPTTPPPGN